MIKKSGLFNTPETWEYLENWILSHSRESHVSLFTAAHMARNYTIDECNKEKDNAVSDSDQ